MKKSTVLIIHLFYWTPAVIQSYVYLTVINYHQVATYPVFSIGVFISELIAFYLFYFFLFPLLSRHKFYSFILYGLMSICVASASGALFAEIVSGIYNAPSFRSDNEHLYIYTITLLVKALYSGVLGSFVRGCLTWYSEIRYKKELERRHLETELALLKAQLNPHFLFNTLNNIDILIEKDPEKASSYLKKLSDMLRFMLHESSSKKILLNQEILYIQQYIVLQKIRTSNPDFITFEIIGDTDHVEIAPMLFIPFIENAFKHTTNKKIKYAIDIKLTVNEHKIHFVCNNIFKQSSKFQQDSGGLGLGLIRTRLELLYKGKYKLNITQNNDRFTVILSLNED